MICRPFRGRFYAGCCHVPWRVDETYVRVKGKWVYLYRAVDSSGATIDFLLSAKREAAAAERFQS
jgi:transposase-like protein